MFGVLHEVAYWSVIQELKKKMAEGGTEESHIYSEFNSQPLFSNAISSFNVKCHAGYRI
jgi:hypothetical protein